MVQEGLSMQTEGSGLPEQPGISLYTAGEKKGVVVPSVCQLKLLHKAVILIHGPLLTFHF